MLKRVSERLARQLGDGDALDLDGIGSAPVLGTQQPLSRAAGSASSQMQQGDPADMLPQLRRNGL